MRAQGRRARESPTHGEEEPCPLPEDFGSSAVVDPARVGRENDLKAVVGDDSCRIVTGTGHTLGVPQPGDRLPFARVRVVAVRARVPVVGEEAGGVVEDHVGAPAHVDHGVGAVGDLRAVISLRQARASSVEEVVHLLDARTIGAENHIDVLPVSLVVGDVVVHRIEVPVLEDHAVSCVEEGVGEHGRLAPRGAVGTRAEPGVGLPPFPRLRAGEVEVPDLEQLRVALGAQTQFDELRQRVEAQPAKGEILEILELVGGRAHSIQAKGIREEKGMDRQELGPSAMEADVVTRGQDQGGSKSPYERLQLGPAGFGNPVSSLAFFGGTEERVRRGTRPDQRRPLIGPDHVQVGAALVPRGGASRGRDRAYPARARRRGQSRRCRRPAS